MISYKKINAFRPGDIQRLLKESYQDLIAYFPFEKDNFYNQWEKEDNDAFKNIDTIGQNLLFTCVNDLPVGYFSWDIRNGPLGVIGQNCILPDYQNRGYGTKQIEQIISIFREYNFTEISVTTGGHMFFRPAQTMYGKCGFQLRERVKGKLFDQIEYFRII